MIVIIKLLEREQGIWKIRFRARLIIKVKSFQSRLQWIKRTNKKCTRNKKQNDKGNGKETKHFLAKIYKLMLSKLY